MNDTLKTIAERYSCRDFSRKMPADEELQAIARAAVSAPSGMNRQPWQVIVVKNQALIDDMEQEGLRIIKEMDDPAMYERIMSRGGTIFYHAPCMIIVAIAKGMEMDCGILSENVALAAGSLGLGSLICGMAGIPFSQGKAGEYKEKLGFLPEYEFGIGILLGYPADGASGTPHEPDLNKISYID